MNRFLRVSPHVGLAALALACAAAWSQSSTPGGSGSSGSSTGTQSSPSARSSTSKAPSLARGDRRFLEEEAAHNMYEMQVAQLAATRATDPSVKEFANKLVEDHTAAHNELTQLASQLGVDLPTEPSRGMRRDLDKMGKKSGAEFDREFVKTVGVKDHQKEIKRLQSASKDLKNSELKAWVDKTLPHLQQHLAAAEKLPQAGSSSGSSMGAGGSSGSGKSGGSGGSSSSGASGSGSNGSGSSGGSGSSTSGAGGSGMTSPGSSGSGGSGSSGSSSGSGKGY